ncbi:MAG: DEAD/DEAH box helicase [Flavobacteriales bacterium]|nr:DEAD/DEAH box helicase [Flavobacteriales bacterium]
MKFEEYNIAPEIKKSLNEMGLRRPTDIQFKSLPAILNREDVLAIAQTGTGKTAAFAIPVLSYLHERKKIKGTDFIRCVVMVPTRELALQITDVFNTIGKYTQVSTLCVFGGVEQDAQIAKLSKGVDILVTTPGRMFDLVSQGFINLSRIEVLVLDEADRMLDPRFISDVKDLIKFLPKQRQTLFFSATIDNKIKKLAYSLVGNKALRIQISPKDPVSRNVTHFVTFIEMDDKRFFLEKLIKENPGQKMLVFVRTKVRAERVHKAMERAGIETGTLHGDKEQKERIRVLNDFREGKFHILIATDVSARGIDVSGVQFVINYDLPEDPENYVHRIGRTGRGTQKGQAISFCSKEEKPLLTEIENLLGKKIDTLKINKDVYKEIVLEAQPEMYKLDELLKEAEELEEKQRKKKKGK